jgi:DNA-nicking Smr family endonuclease
MPNAKPPRGLSEEEAAAWAKLASSVTPFDGRAIPRVESSGSGQAAAKPAAKISAKMAQNPMAGLLANSAKKGLHSPTEMTPRPRETSPRPVFQSADHARQTGLDGSWERKLRSGQIAPDFTLDLHGHNLDSAHARLDSGMMQAHAMDARVVLLIAGKLRPVEAADRGSRRGAIRAKILDWLAAGPHGSAIAAVRKAHRRHGGEGALYLVLKRPR